MNKEDGIAHIALGLGRTVVEGGSALRFSPPHPQFLGIRDCRLTLSKYLRGNSDEGCASTGKEDQSKHQE